MTRSPFLFAALLGLLAGLGAAPAPAPPADTRPAPAIAAAARQAMAEARYDDALDLYGELRQRHPELPQVPFNLGVAAYRAGDLEQAAAQFESVLALAEDPALRARAAYNLGTTAHARALAPPTAAAPDAAPDPAGQLDAASEALESALDHYRQALDLDPADGDAKANAELAQRMLDRLQQMREQMPPSASSGEGDEQQGEEQEGEGETPPPPGEQNEDQPQEGDQGEGQEQERDQGEGGQGRQDQEGEGQPPPPESSGEDETSEGEDESSPSPAPGDETGEDTETPSPADAAEGRDEGEERRGMTREEAERLLQGVRDKERQRREAEARRAASRQPPVEKDW